MRSVSFAAPPAGGADGDGLVGLAEVSEIELIILKRMREFTLGDHRSQFHGPGFDLVGLREWQPGDRLAWIDWPQSSLTNFSPLAVRDFEQPSTATVIAVADHSLSTRCGDETASIAVVIARAIATIGMSAVFFQDAFGLVTFDTGSGHLAAVRPKIGKGQVVHCLDAYQRERGLQPMKQAGSLSMSIGGFLRNRSLIPVISDCLFERPEIVFGELADLNSIHDVFLVLIDSAFAFELPLSAGWVHAFDVETGRSCVLSRAGRRALAARAREWQGGIERSAKALGLDVVRLGIDEVTNMVALVEFVAERRLRKR
jgi:uncharacterized protein (DUF58 family)